MSFRQGARQFFSGGRLPYDAEVEYLESTGTQWIDTGITPSAATECNIDLMFTGKTIQQFGTGRESSSKWAVILGYYQYGQYGISFWAGVNQTTRRSTHIVNERVLCGFSIPNGTYWLGGNPTADANLTAPTTDCPTFALFARKNATNDLSGYCTMRVFSAEINGVEGVRDFVPVRFTNELGQSEGAMYDKVSRRLFRNQGTGAFLCGRDVKPISARSYVKDGLIAMWDGIENAGWGTHDPNATTWVDLIGGRVVQNVDSSQVGSNYMLSDGVHKLYLPVTQDVFGDNLTIEACVTDIVKRSNYFAILAADNDYCSIYWNYQTTSLMWKMNSGSTRPPITFTGGTSSAVKKSDYYRLYANAVAGIEVRGGTMTWGNSPLQWSNPWDDRRGTLKAHCYRFYSRDLTADEVAANHAVDVQRFNLT